MVPGSHAGEPAPRRLIDTAELVRLRWVAVAGEAAVALGLTLLHVHPLAPALLPLVVAGAFSNLVLARRGPKAPEAGLATMLALDIVVLTVSLALTGGAMSPFVPMYLVFPVLGALLLRPSMAWGTFLLVLCSYAMLFLVPGDPQAHRMWLPGLTHHALGMYISTAAASPFLLVTVMRTRRALTYADRELALARRAEERNARLASLATLAAGAAHELSSPLGTIAVVAHELIRRTESGDARTHEDALLVREEVERCRRVLDELAADVGAGSAELARPTAVDELVLRILEGHRDVETRIQQGLGGARFELPPRLVAQAVRRLVGNALAVTPPGVPVRVDIRRVSMAEGEASLIIAVRDEGPGMPPEVLARATEPFFTTKPEGSGRGLGLWFVQSVAAHLGGHLDLQSIVGQGTTASLVLPARGTMT
ncbi:MAG: HAMP domain-containing histidine kinase [Alphaproteobacteria bacterium]|nr:HAMP domain-containing histidine kinase [Alphaproteobacteria bacterium]